MANLAISANGVKTDMVVLTLFVGEHEATRNVVMFGRCLVHTQRGEVGVMTEETQMVPLVIMAIQRWTLANQTVRQDAVELGQSPDLVLEPVDSSRMYLGSELEQDWQGSSRQ